MSTRLKQLLKRLADYFVPQRIFLFAFVMQRERGRDTTKQFCPSPGVTPQTVFLDNCSYQNSNLVLADKNKYFKIISPSGKGRPFTQSFKFTVFMVDMPVKNVEHFELLYRPNILRDVYKNNIPCYISHAQHIRAK